MELKMTTASGNASKKTVEVSDATFARDYNEALIHQVVTAYMAGARQGTRGHKNRSAVSGGGAKPWRQKGTGRARAGTIRSPIWRSGGKTFAAETQDHSQKVNRKMYRAAMATIFSELVRQERLIVLANLKMDAPKTKELAGKLADMDAKNALIVTGDFDEKLFLSSRNLANVSYLEADRINPVDLIRFEKVVMTEDAVKKVEEMLA